MAAWPLGIDAPVMSSLHHAHHETGPDFNPAHHLRSAMVTAGARQIVG